MDVDRLAARYDRDNPRMWWWRAPRIDIEHELTGMVAVAAATVGRWDLYEQAAEFVGPESFADPDARHVWTTIADAYPTRGPVDVWPLIDLVGVSAGCQPQAAALFAVVLHSEHAQWD